MKPYIYCSLIGNIIGLFYAIERWLGMTFAAVPNKWHLAKNLYLLLPIGLSATGIITGLLFLFSQRFSKLFNIIMSFSTMNAGFLIIESLYTLISYSFFGTNLKLNSFVNFIEISPIIYFTLISISIIGVYTYRNTH
ncbi:hypothetical protein BN2127_JRS10_02673 [Bacillus subtilis]|nr:hypothetical protein BN2127_JRS10_02673 [Bacillus subtilis]